MFCRSCWSPYQRAHTSSPSLRREEETRQPLARTPIIVSLDLSSEKIATNTMVPYIPNIAVVSDASNMPQKDDIGDCLQAHPF